MLVKIKISGRVISVKDDEGQKLIDLGFAKVVEIDPPAKFRENALRKGKRERR
jgi:hypothetical protein